MKDQNQLQAMYEEYINGYGTSTASYNTAKAIQELFGAGNVQQRNIDYTNSLVALINKAVNGEDVLDDLLQSIIALMVIAIAGVDPSYTGGDLADRFKAWVISTPDPIDLDDDTTLNTQNVVLFVPSDRVPYVNVPWQDKGGNGLVISTYERSSTMRFQVGISLAGSVEWWWRYKNPSGTDWFDWQLIASNNILSNAEKTTDENYFPKTLIATGVAHSGVKYYRFEEPTETKTVSNVNWDKAYTAIGETTLGGVRTAINYRRETPMTYTSGDLYEIDLEDVTDTSTISNNDPAWAISGADSEIKIKNIVAAVSSQTGTNKITLAQVYAAGYYKFSLAPGEGAVVAGKNTLATGDHSFAAGEGCVAVGNNQTVVGRYNVPVADAYFVVGNGTDDEHRHNVLIVDGTGHAYDGDGGKYATESYVNEKTTAIAEETREQVGKYVPTMQEAVENSRNLLRIYGTYFSGANGGVQFDWNGDKYILYGTSATGSVRSIVNSPTILPAWLVPGSVLRVVIAAAYSGTASSSNIRLQFLFYTDATNYVQRNASVSQDIKVPAGVTGIVLRLYVEGGTNCGTKMNPTKYAIGGYASKSNAALNDMLDDVIGQINSAENAISGLNNFIPTVDDLITSNSMDLMRLYQNYYSHDTSGMHFVWDEATNSFRIYGRPTGTCYKTMMLYSDALPAGFTPGKSYTVLVRSDLSDGTYYGVNIRGRVTYYEGGTAGEPITLTSSVDGSERTITIPATCTGIKFDIRVDGAISEITESNPVVFSMRIYDPANVAKKLSRLSDAAVIYRKTLTNSDDLDEIKQSGIYYYASTSRPAHYPTAHNSYLVVFANISQTSCIQFVINNTSGVNAFYYRVCFSGKFSQWYTLAKTKDIPDSSGTTPDTIYIDSNGNGGSAIVFDEDGRDIPQNYGVINAYRRAHQMTDIVYTTLARTPSVNSNTGVPAATYRGIPYSSVKEIETYVPTDVSFETFMTAVHNPYSLLYTEAVAKETGVRESLSKYGFNYNGTNGTCGLYYGAVCTQFAWYALGVDERWITANFNYLTTIGKLMKVYDNSGTGVRLMDLILEFTAAGNPHHARLVTDIYRNKRGVPERIFVSEAIAESAFVTDDDGNQFRTRGCRTTEYTLAEFNRVCIGEQRGQIFRYLQLYKNLDYEASDFVAVEDETPVAYSYNDDICTFAGNKAAFRKGFPVFINYEQGEYTNLVITKDGTEIASIDITGGYEEGDRADTHSIEVTAYCDSAGKYTAHLANGSTASASTLWEVLDTTTSIAGALNNITVSFVKESNPMYIEFISATGGQLSLYQLSQEEKTKGSATFDAVAYSEQTTGANLAETHFVRVKYHGDYGNVISEKIALSTL